MFRTLHGWLIVHLSERLIFGLKLWRSRYGWWVWRKRYTEEDGARVRRIYAFGGLGLNFALNVVWTRRGALPWVADPNDLVLREPD